MLDISFFQFLNSFSEASPLLDQIIIFFSLYFPYLVVFSVIIAFIYPKSFKFSISDNVSRIVILIGLFVALFSRFAIKEGVVFLFNRPRPFEVLEGVNQLIEHGSMASFPSGHAIFFFTLATILVFYSRKLGILIFISSILIILSRIIAGVHWPSDVIAGAAMGIIVGLIGVYVTSHLVRYKED